ncbi:MAG: ATP-dependent DNA helicase RecG [Bacteroidales bacterium]
MENSPLNTDIKFIQGVGPKRAEIFNSELHIFTFRDLLNYFPYKHLDRSKIYKIAELDAGIANVQLIGRFISLKTEGAGGRARLVARFADDTGVIEIVWFQGIKWVKESLNYDKKFLLFGKPTFYNGKINIVHPELEEIDENEKLENSGLQAVYTVTEKMKKAFISSKTINRMQFSVLNKCFSFLEESLPQNIITSLKLISYASAIKEIHFPTDLKMLDKAIFRLKFDELFFIQLQLLSKKYARSKRLNGFRFSKIADNVNVFYKKHLPFELTNAQKKVIKEIRADLGSGKQMNRLLQGDVGSGKTLVALMTMLIGLDNGFQVCLMAPTEILAKQHFESIGNLIKELNIKIDLLTGSTRQKGRNEILENLQSGELQIIIGTHALIEDKVVFKNLGLVVIDEQHRFGVQQRARLWEKNINPPHILVMTATPIPRTLAMTLYGDLDVSVIDELPPGRKPITTLHYQDSKRLKLFGFLKKEIAEGRQVYIVYPLITESETMDYKDLEDGLESISRAFPSPAYTIAVVHGRMKAEEKDKAMNLFKKGMAQILISTTVIEVGVDVPNASVMVIESAERFGLSQLHQLRGRVGRGADQSFCILMTSYKLSADARIRMETMVQSNNGFDIAEADLKLRGPGDIEGTQQSGVPFNLNLANLAKDGPILQLARNYANDLLEKDNLLENEDNIILKKQLGFRQQHDKTWGLIS